MSDYVMLENQCPVCGKILMLGLSKPEDYPKTCVCGAELPEPDYDGLERYIKSIRLESEMKQAHYDYMDKKYGNIPRGGYTDEVFEEMCRDNAEFYDRLAAAKHAIWSGGSRRQPKAGPVESSRARVDRARKERPDLFGAVDSGTERQDR